MPSITKVYLDTVLVDRVAALLELFEMPLVKDGTNLATVDPITASIGVLGIVPLTWGEIVQEDLDAIPSSKSYQVLDLAEYRLLETMHNRALGLASTRVGTQSEVRWKDVADSIAVKMKALRSEIDRKYMKESSSLVGGIIRLNTVTKCRSLWAEGE